MAGKLTLAFFLLAAAFLQNFHDTNATPAIERNAFKYFATGYDPMGICIENCAQCKKMLGSWFEGQLCADTCIKFKGKLIPDCEDLGSISPFLNKL